MAHMDGDRTDIRATPFDLPGVDAGADGDSEVEERASHRMRALNRSHRTVEGGEHAVARGLDQTTTMIGDLAIGDPIVGIEHLTPATIAEFDGLGLSSRQCR